MWLSEINKVKTFFIERDNYRKQLRRAIAKYGAQNLPPAMQRTIPANMAILYELPWKFNLIVIFRMFQIAYLNAEKACIRKIINEN